MRLDEEQFTETLNSQLPGLDGPAVKSGLAVIDDLEETFWEEKAGPSENVSINFD